MNIKPGKNKPFIVGNVRRVMDMIAVGDISYSRGVELFNQIAAKYYEKHINKVCSCKHNKSVHYGEICECGGIIIKSHE